MKLLTKTALAGLAALAVVLTGPVTAAEFKPGSRVGQRLELCADGGARDAGQVGPAEAAAAEEEDEEEDQDDGDHDDERERDWRAVGHVRRRQ